MPLSEKTWRVGWMTLAAIGMVAVVWNLFATPHTHIVARPVVTAQRPVGPVRVEGSQIAVDLESPVYKRLSVQAVAPQTVSHPLVVVTGSVIARVRSGPGDLEDRWQFVTSELSEAYAELLKSRSDIDFARERLQKTRELAAAQEAHYQTVVNRLSNVSSGGVALKELTAAKAELLQTQLQGQKDIYAEQTALRVAQRQLASDERELIQQGLEPEVLARARDGMVLVAAQVPESKISLIHEQQSCQARFFGVPDKTYSAHVEHLGSVLNSERRTLRVLFDLKDDEQVLRPGMFGHVDLGTDERAVILVPNEAVIHIGRYEYVFKQAEPGRFAVVRIEAMEPQGDVSEVAAGLQAGDQIVSAGAILLKPLAAQIVSSR